MKGLLPTRSVEGRSFEEKCGVWGKETTTDISGFDHVEKEASDMDLSRSDIQVGAGSCCESETVPFDHKDYLFTNVVQLETFRAK
jgi:hypothetical protein